MWFEADELAEIFKGYFPYYLIIALPLFIIISPVNPVGAAHEFPAYRMQHFDLHGVPHGCRSAPVSLEARPLQSWGSSSSTSQRHCLVAPLSSVTPQLLREALGASGNGGTTRAGALLFILPPKGSLTAEEKQKILETEETLLWGQGAIPIPIYFAHHSPQLVAILEDISSSFLVDSRPRSALQALMNAVSANGYQVSVNSGQASPMPNVFVANIQDWNGNNKNAEVLIKNARVIAEALALVMYNLSTEHQIFSNSLGVDPSSLDAWVDYLSSQPRSAQLLASKQNPLVLTLQDAMSRYTKEVKVSYLSPDKRDPEFVFYDITKAIVNVYSVKPAVFDLFLTIAILGYLAAIYAFIQDSLFVLCLDSLSASTNNNHTLYMHVSKPPKEGTPAAQFLQGKLPGHGLEDKLPTIAIVAHYDSFGVAPILKGVANNMYGGSMSVELIHKKINLAEESLAWEHERHSIRRLPAFTLSDLQELAFGSDSNASGVALLLELARLFSHLYSQPRSHPHTNLLFLLSSAGKFNFQGSKRWLEDHLDASDSTLLQVGAGI
ncbi:hypothetical protein J437_LFUL003885 [Ladona fulva]|uniref:BOS complex subunit NCLN n=1 Tax=Ladona fulva TaxID=123851 RepID=A0A8K0P0E3_LADFU|nr:hypothetical protein J437_LFUL003885 [Ladona fulva]